MRKRRIVPIAKRPEKPKPGFYVIDSVLSCQSGWTDHVLAWSPVLRVAQAIADSENDRLDSDGDYVVIRASGEIV